MARVSIDSWHETKKSIVQEKQVSAVLEGMFVWSHCPDSVIYNGRGAGGALYIQGIVFFRTGRVPVEVGDLVGLGGRL
jgi:hypothetical protein